MTNTERIEPWVLHIPDAAIRDLRSRLSSARLPEPATSTSSGEPTDRWHQGVPLEDLSALVEYWRTSYSWRSFEARLNRIGQYRTVIDGLGIHFLYRTSSRHDALPLLMTHGWPGSIAEFIDVIDDLAEPEDPDAPAFHVIAPSLPGFGFSDRPAAEGWGVEKIAATWVELMRRLGYPRFLAHGGDWGGPVTTVLGGRYPEHVIGIHSTFAEALEGATTDQLTEHELGLAYSRADFWAHHSAYAKQQATRPQTIGYALVDSPVGLLAWIVDKFAEWTDTTDSPFEAISIDRVLDNVSTYWFTATGASAARIYRESHGALDPQLRVDVPAAITIYPRDFGSMCPETWAKDRYLKLVRWREPSRGGHFPALEVPHFFVDDLRKGLSTVLATHD